ncbi:hypothetical protein FOZ63_018265 [Perkinsus olseni]|uniref:Uncharacterized protein n=1 Tax=Perkinsus olseni TaxID=32597 RepID=A0A7J6TCF0_PEROL|nr:hypothetical protein FOZ62_015874 [Perkinsus olseni]KAF4757620.1 hypothetical protein FOZ63_018265 [Perkinsus olseni]
MAAFMRRKKKLNDRKVKSAHLPDSFGKQVQLVAVNRMDLDDDPPAAAATAPDDEEDGPPPSTLTPNNNVDGVIAGFDTEPCSCSFSKDHPPGGYSSVLTGRKVNTSDRDSPFRFTFVANSRIPTRAGVETLFHKDLFEDVLPELGVGPYPAQILRLGLRSPRMATGQGLSWSKAESVSCENELEAIGYIIAKRNQYYAADASRENGIKNNGTLVPWAIGSLLFHRDFVGQFERKEESEELVCEISGSFKSDDGSQLGVAVEAAWSELKGRFEISSFATSDEQGTSTRANSEKIERLNSLIWGSPAAHQRPLLVLNLRNQATVTAEISRSVDRVSEAPSGCRRYLRYVALVLKHIEGRAKYLPEGAITHGGDEDIPAVIHAYVTASEDVGKKKGGSEAENAAL